ncbi:MAG: lytic murein transglycosylase [Sphingomonadales bacterium]|nr:lytic murein transglycosylase [Sphingomonadales bacterium]
MFGKIRLATPLGLIVAAFSAPIAVVTAQDISAPVVLRLPDSADSADGFRGYLQLVGAKARGQGVSQGAIDTITGGLTYNPRVVSLDRAQPGSTPGSPPAFWGYYAKHIGAERINLGRAALSANAGLLGQAEGQYGVPRKMIVAIWGKETFYGRIKGDFDLARSLATLAYEGRRRDLFEGELIALMKMADRGVPRSRMFGSWAGAFGNPQFLPSVYLRVARDGDGDGDADIWNSRADTFASIANYFKDAGWRQGEPWGVRAFAPSSINRGLLTNRLESPSCPAVHNRHSVWKTVAEWRALGVVPQAPIADQTMAVLFEPDGPANGSFLLTGNYRVILQYNCSNYYALSVGLLADEIAR